jgi:Flp pilus assembly protein TadD
VSRLYIAIGLPVLGLAFSISGCALLSQSSADPAERIRQQRLRAAAEATPVDLKSQSVEEKLSRGDALRRDGAYAAAMWTYLQAHELDPDHPEPTARMGSLHLLVDPERAESIFRELVATHPESGAAHTGLGLALVARHEWLEAREVLTRAVGISSRSAAAYSALGVVLDRLGQHTEAREAYTRAITLQPRYYEALNNLGVSYLTTEEFAAAENVLRKASLQQNRDPAVFNNLGLALGRMERYAAAFDAFERAGSEQVARSNLGYVCFLNGDYERAVAEYERALLVGGEQRLLVLRNLLAAQRAEKELDTSAEN